MDAIIGLVISAVMVALFAAASKKSAKSARGGAENFPFPTDVEDMEDVEMSDGRAIAQIADERVVIEAPRAIPPTIKADKPIEIERIDNRPHFDLRQAVVYDAILNPKSNDNLL